MSKKERKICEFEMYLSNFFCLRSNLSNDNNNFCLKARSENRCGKLHFFRLKSGQDLKNRAAHPAKNSQEYPPLPVKIIKLIYTRKVERLPLF